MDDKTQTNIDGKTKRFGLIAASALVVALTAPLAAVGAQAAHDDGGFTIRSVDADGFEGFAGMKPKGGGTGGTQPGSGETPGTNPGSGPGTGSGQTPGTNPGDSGSVPGPGQPEPFSCETNDAVVQSEGMVLSVLENGIDSALPGILQTSLRAGSVEVTGTAASAEDCLVDFDLTFVVVAPERVVVAPTAPRAARSARDHDGTGAARWLAPLADRWHFLYRGGRLRCWSSRPDRHGSRRSHPSHRHATAHPGGGHGRRTAQVARPRADYDHREQ